MKSSGGPGAAPPPPVRPRKAVFIVMCILFLAWIGVMLLIYFKTVYPIRH
jgi:hypothetical protein